MPQAYKILLVVQAVPWESARKALNRTKAQKSRGDRTAIKRDCNIYHIMVELCNIHCTVVLNS